MRDSWAKPTDFRKNYNFTHVLDIAPQKPKTMSKIAVKIPNNSLEYEFTCIPFGFSYL